MKNFYVDEPCVVSFFVGEIGWFLQRFQAHMRYLKQEVYPNHKFLIFVNPHLHAFVHDFVDFTIDLPQDFYNLNFDSDGYEAVIPTAPAGSFTPAGVYQNIIKYCRNFYNKDKAIEVWTPRGCSRIMDTMPQLFAKYNGNPMNLDRPAVTVFPRARTRASNRNVPEYVWKELIDVLKQNFMVCLAGTPKGACLQDYEDPNVTNLIKYSEIDKTDKIIHWLYNSVCSISSQSGGTHISLLCDCPSYIIGHEKERHAFYENRYKTQVSFRVVSDYRAIDVQTIIQDVASFLHVLEQNKLENKKSVEDTVSSDKDKLKEMINKGVDNG